MPQVYVSLGSNIEPQLHVCACLQALSENFKDLHCSTIYRTAAVGFKGEPFLNAVVGFQTELTSVELKAWLRQLEEQQGRERGAQKFSARTLDLDLLLYNDIVEPAHKLPHPDILTYSFVLQPLAELAPTQNHPVLGKTFSALAAKQLELTEALEPIRLDCVVQWQINEQSAL